MTWELIFFLVILKIPVAYLVGVVWWAVRAEPRPFEGAIVTAELRPDPPQRWHSRRLVPRGPRSGPHGSPGPDGGSRSPSDEREGQAMKATPSSLRAGGERPAAVIAGYLAVGAIFVALFGIVERPVRIEPAAAVIALIAVGMAGPRQRKLTATAVAVAGSCFFLGMVVAVLTSHALW